LRIRIPFLCFFILLLGCENNFVGLEEIRNNPLDLDQVEYEVPAFAFFPDQFNVLAGESFLVEVYAVGALNLFGVTVSIEYDLAKLNLESVANGNLSLGTDPLFFVDSNDPGIIEVVSVHLNQDPIGLNGNIKICELLFVATTKGESILNFSNDCEMLDPIDQSIEIKGLTQGVVIAQ